MQLQNKHNQFIKHATKIITNISAPPDFLSVSNHKNKVEFWIYFCKHFWMHFSLSFLKEKWEQMCQSRKQ